LGYLKGIAGGMISLYFHDLMLIVVPSGVVFEAAGGIYALAFGLMGLIPAPKVRRQ
jgi:hypothetical protein